MNPAQLDKAARIAGVLYLVVVVTGVLALMVFPGRLIVPGDAAATASRILGSQSLYRLEIVNGLVSVLLFLCVALALYRLLHEVHRPSAAVMVILVLVQIPLGVGGVMKELAALDVLRGEGFWAAFPAAQRNALAMSYLDVNHGGTPAVEILWGLWLFPLAFLVLRSRFLPRFLGVWLGINGLAYVVLSVAGMLWPRSYDSLKPFALPALLGEVALTLWLLIMGARSRPGKEAAALAA